MSKSDKRFTIVLYFKDSAAALMRLNGLEILSATTDPDPPLRSAAAGSEQPQVRYALPKIKAQTRRTQRRKRSSPVSCALLREVSIQLVNEIGELTARQTKEQIRMRAAGDNKYARCWRQITSPRGRNLNDVMRDAAIAGQLCFKGKVEGEAHGAAGKLGQWVYGPAPGHDALAKFAG